MTVERSGLHGPARLLLLTALALVLGTGTAAQSQHITTIVSPDVTIRLADPVTDQSLANHQGDSIPVTQLERPVDLIGFHRNPESGVDHLAYETAVRLPNDFLARQGDIVLYDGAHFVVAISARGEGAPLGAEFDAVTFDGLVPLVSLDISAEIRGLVVHDEDVIRLTGGVPDLFFDGSAAGVPAALDVDGLHLLEQPRRLMLSFDGSGRIAGIDFADEDVLIYNLETGTWAPWFDASQSDIDWVSADLNALTAVVEPVDTTLFADGFESGNTEAWDSI